GCLIAIAAGCVQEPEGPSSVSEARVLEEQQYDSLITVYASALAAGDYQEAEQGAEALLSELEPSHEDTDTLRAIADKAEELRLYAVARAIPASQLQENATAYRDLATRHPTNPVYREKADYYERRVREEATRQARRSASRSTRRST